MELLTTSNIIFALGLLGTMFTIYNYFRDPQVKSEKNDAVTDIKIGTLEANMKTVLENHLPHIDQRLNNFQMSIDHINQNIVRLTTIIDERIPKKQ